MAEPQTQCPGCADLAIVQRSRAPDLFVWVADGWRDTDGLEVEIDFCPSCGAELLDSDEYGELPSKPVSDDLAKVADDLAEVFGTGERTRAELIAELAQPCPGSDPPTKPRVDVGRRFPDGYFHHEAIVGMIPSGHGFIYQWGGDAMVEGQFLPEFMQPRVISGDVVRIRCHEPGRFVAFIRCDDGQAYCVGFNRCEP